MNALTADDVLIVDVDDVSFTIDRRQREPVEGGLYLREGAHRPAAFERRVGRRWHDEKSGKLPRPRFAGPRAITGRVIWRGRYI